MRSSDWDPERGSAVGGCDVFAIHGGVCRVEGVSCGTVLYCGDAWKPTVSVVAEVVC